MPASIIRLVVADEAVVTRHEPSGTGGVAGASGAQRC